MNSTAYLPVETSKVILLHPHQSQEQTTNKQNDQARHEPSPRFGIPHTPMHINSTSLLAIIKL